ncbi:hypothetical protein C3486_07005 [Streptomyces sp. Ru73]|uniref:chaplin n=1 Tax=Streptomyces sp. Ru73 TaxID=2080748 RepID=UPI000CDE2FBD|nr:chaplin [Streptomyces sp. Ru73]POX41962.1 hypothetical protein C3486_07005 [Streptomyces sp. Ru73]
MRQVLAKGLLAAAATTGVLGVTGGAAFADAGASSESSNSPGVLSGNTVEAPVELPANACGNGVDVIGALNPSFGNGCASDGGGHDRPAQGAHQERSALSGGGDTGSTTRSGGDDRTGGGNGGGASAAGSAQNSPGVGSGNNAQAPVDVPVNACGNTVDVVGLLNPVFGNHCDSSHEQEQQHADESVPHHVTPEAPRPAAPEQPRAGAETGTRPAHQATAPHAAEPESFGTQLAHTGTEQIGAVAGAGAALVLGGAILYRRARHARR